MHIDPSKRANLLFVLLGFLSMGLVSTEVLHGQGDLRAYDDDGNRSLKIKDICRIKGQEENVLQGLGLVFGLKGTGDGDVKPTVRQLTRLMQLMGGQVASDIQGRLLDKEMANSKNVAAVIVTATIPAAGLEQGDKISCRVSAISAKSLEGGQLMMTQMLGPRADQPVVFGLAQGSITIEDPRVPTVGKVSGGCKMEMAVRNEYVAGNKLTLILDPDHSSFTTSQYIEDVINDFHKSGTTNLSQGNSISASKIDPPPIARAIDQMHVEVIIPPYYLDGPVKFVSLIESLPLINLKNKKRVIISERDGIMSISEDVTIAPVAITHNKLVITPRSNGTAGNNFVGVPQDKSQPRPTLKSLVDALNVLDVPTSDKIAIIKLLKHQGALYGELIIE